MMKKKQRECARPGRDDRKPQCVHNSQQPLIHTSLTPAYLTDMID